MEILPVNSRIGSRVQVVVEKEFQRKGVPKLMLTWLKPILKSRYDLLFSTAKKNNPKTISLEKAGWEIILEDKENYYCTYKLLEN